MGSGGHRSQGGQVQGGEAAAGAAAGGGARQSRVRRPGAGDRPLRSAAAPRSCRGGCARPAPCCSTCCAASLCCLLPQLCAPTPLPTVPAHRELGRAGCRWRRRRLGRSRSGRWSSGCSPPPPPPPRPAPVGETGTAASTSRRARSPEAVATDLPRSAKAVRAACGHWQHCCRQERVLLRHITGRGANISSLPMRAHPMHVHPTHGCTAGPANDRWVPHSAQPEV